MPIFTAMGAPRRALKRASRPAENAKRETVSSAAGPLPRALVHTTKGLGYPDMNGLRSMHASVTTCLLASCALAAVAGASAIRGTLAVGPRSMAAQAATNPYPGQAGSMPGMHTPQRGLVTDAIVYLERVPADADSILAKLPSHPQLAQRDQAFVPRVLPVAVGTSVEFPNQDPIYHNVFSVSPVKRFDLGKYPRGQSKRVLFSRPGLVNVYCDIHSDMEAFVLVLPNHAFTQPSAAGAFSLDGIPAGHYALHVWHPDLGELKREVDVPDGSDAAVELSY